MPIRPALLRPRSLRVLPPQTCRNVSVSTRLSRPYDDKPDRKGDGGAGASGLEPGQTQQSPGIGRQGVGAATDTEIGGSNTAASAASDTRAGDGNQGQKAGQAYTGGGVATEEQEARETGHKKERPRNSEDGIAAD